MIDVFRVGVHIGMTTNGPQVLAVLLRDLGLLHGSVDSIITKLGKFKLAIGGAVAAFAGTKALEGLWHIVEASRELNKELNRTKQLGGDFAATVGRAREVAFSTSYAVPTTTPSENVRVQRELATQLQNPGAAADILPFAQRAAYVVANFTGEKIDDIIKNLVKVADIRAQIFSRDATGKEVVDPAKVQSEFEAAARGLILAGNYLKSGDLVQMARQAGVPAKGMTQEAFYAAMVEAAVSQGAARTGTAITSLFSQMVGGTMPVHVAEEMQRMGLMRAGEWRSDHGHVVMQPSVTERMQGIQSDPIGFITGPLDAMLTARGMDAQAKLLEVFKLFGRQTTQRLVAEAMSAEPQFTRARSMFQGIPNTRQEYTRLYNEDLDTNIKSFQAAWKGLMEALGEQGVPVAISLIHNLTDALHAMTAWAVAHPNASRHLLEFAAAIAAVAAVGGSLKLVTVALKPFATGIRLLSGALAGGTAAAAGATALAGGVRTLIGILGGALSLPALVGGALFGTLALGSQSFTPESQKNLEDEAKARRQGAPVGGVIPQGAVGGTPNDGFGPDGRPLFQRQSYVPPATGTAAQPIHINVAAEVDGQVLLRMQARALLDGARTPSNGTTGPDFRAGVFGAGMMTA